MGRCTVTLSVIAALALPVLARAQYVDESAKTYSLAYLGFLEEGIKEHLFLGLMIWTDAAGSASSQENRKKLVFASGDYLKAVAKLDTELAKCRGAFVVKYAPSTATVKNNPLTSYRALKLCAVSVADGMVKLWETLIKAVAEFPTYGVNNPALLQFHREECTKKLKSARQRLAYLKGMTLD